MCEQIILEEDVSCFSRYLFMEEKSTATIQKYIRDVRAFMRFAGKAQVTKEVAMAYKKECLDLGYAVRSVNSMISSINSFFAYKGWSNCKVKILKIQRKVYCPEEKELTKAEYMRLLSASREDKQLNLVLQTICATGIRVSELQYFTVEALQRSEISINCKNKIRTIIVPEKLKKLLLKYAKHCKITSGAVFVGRNGQAVDRSSIWRKMKNLCEAAGVKESKVFPHNLRKLFARTFYGIEKDIAKLADILGHSSINTTRIYIMSTGVEHRVKIERLGLLV